MAARMDGRGRVGLVGVVGLVGGGRSSTTETLENARRGRVERALGDSRRAAWRVGRRRRTSATHAMVETYERDDSSDSDERARKHEGKDSDDDDGDDDGGEGDGLNWDNFWQRASRRNEAKMRKAGLDPTKEESKIKFGRHGQQLDRGRPRAHAQVYCFGCDSACGDAYECAQCLEIYRDRAKKVPFDSWERAFFCSHDCYVHCWGKHKARHTETTAGPTKLDGQVHTFEAPLGNGALWHTEDLRRIEFGECVPL